MDSSRSQDGSLFISVSLHSGYRVGPQLTSTQAVVRFIQKHERAFANALHMTRNRRHSTSALPTTSTISQSTSSSALTNAFSLSSLSFRSRNHKSAQLVLTPHHLFYLLSRIEELDIGVGPMSVRAENIHDHGAVGSYVSFLQPRGPVKERGGDNDSMHSVSSVRSAVSGIAAFWNTIGLSSESSRSEKAKAAALNELKYLYSTFTKMPALRLGPDHHCPLIQGFEQFPFETAVPLFAFKNLQRLEVVDLDFRTVFGWDRLADQLRSLTIRRGKVEDPADLLTHVVLDDAEQRRRRSTRRKDTSPPTATWSVPSTPQTEYAPSQGDSSSPEDTTPGTSPARDPEEHKILAEIPACRRRGSSHLLTDGQASKRPTSHRHSQSYRHTRTYSTKGYRTGSTHSSDLLLPSIKGGNQDLGDTLSASKWQWLVQLSLADNDLHTLPAQSLAPVASSLRHLTLSSNLFTVIPEGLSSLTQLVMLDLSNCMIDSLQNLMDQPLRTVTYLNLRSNRLRSLTGIERLSSLEKLDIQHNELNDPAEMMRLTSMPNLKRLWVKRNPLTRTYADYRIRIMNIFRSSAPFTGDVILDDQPATSSERKYLIDPLPDLEVSTIAVTSATGFVWSGDAVTTELGQDAKQDEAGQCSKSAKKRPVAWNESVLSSRPPPPGHHDAHAQMSMPVKNLQLSGRPPHEDRSTVKHELDMKNTLAAAERYQRSIDASRVHSKDNWLGAQHIHTAGPNHSRPPPQCHHASHSILAVGGEI